VLRSGAENARSIALARDQVSRSDALGVSNPTPCAR